MIYNVKKRILTAIIATILFAPVSVYAQVPFGGMIKSIKPCINPPGLVVNMASGETLLYLPGLSISFLFGPPTHPGQFLLGLAGKGVSCFTRRRHGHWKSPLSGKLILFHGSSI
jgi:hypothetical protein